MLLTNVLQEVKRDIHVVQPTRMTCMNTCVQQRQSVSVLLADLNYYYPVTRMNARVQQELLTNVLQEVKRDIHELVCSDQ